MDAVKNFFAKHHAVPVVTPRRGVERIAYEAATDAAMIGHAEGNCAAWDQTELPAHVRLATQNELVAIRGELWKRMAAMRAGAATRGSEELVIEERYGPNPTPLAVAFTALQAAWATVIRRVGHDLATAGN